ncbi:MAG: ABC transporter substrate-binding protein [Christensenellales bacterium]|jgi:branched-chain amino acid transport system substrate-binding protein
MLMKKIMSLVVATVLILGLTGSVLAEQETYRVGMLLPLTGPSASGGQDAKKGVEMAVDYINADGGIKGKKLEMIYCDANDADSGIAETTRLIEVEKVQLVAGTYASAVSFAASTIAEQQKIVFYEMASPSADLTKRGYQYYFRLNPSAFDEGAYAVEFLVGCAEKLGTTEKDIRIAVIGEDSSYGSSICEGAVAKLKELGLEPVVYETYSRQVTDMSSLIMKLINSNCDAVISGSILVDCTLFYRQAYELGLEVKAIVGNGAGFGSTKYYDTFGQLAEYTMCTNYTIENSPIDNAPELRKFYADYRQRYNQDPVNNHLVSQVAQGVMILGKILNSAEDIYSPDSIREAFLSIDIPSGTMINGWGAKFADINAPEPGQNMATGNVIVCQWQNGELWQVYPVPSEGIEIVLPAPPFGG